MREIVGVGTCTQKDERDSELRAGALASALTEFIYGVMQDLKSTHTDYTVHVVTLPPVLEPTGFKTLNVGATIASNQRECFQRFTTLKTDQIYASL